METLARTPLQLWACIRERRRKMGMTQEQLAATVGMRQRILSNLETSASVRLDSASMR
jgi:transcriptional regulator with XRE-family HTH domain